MMSTAVKVAVFTTQTEALIASEYLRANGIVATVMGDDAGGEFSGLVLSKGFKSMFRPVMSHLHWSYSNLLPCRRNRQTTSS